MLGDMYRYLACFLVGSFLAPLAGCDEPVTCTADSRTSLIVTVVDAETGEPVDTAKVEFTVDGDGPFMPQWKEAGAKFPLAMETTGTFEVTVVADGYETAVEEFEIDADECHVITQEATIELTPSA